VWAKQLLDGHPVELWSGARFVVRLDLGGGVLVFIVSAIQSMTPLFSDGFRLTAEEFDVVRTHRFIAFTCTFVQAVKI
jgi:hypothetical protein